jgi:hypothetical protein
MNIYIDDYLLPDKKTIDEVFSGDDGDDLIGIYSINSKEY